MRHARMIVLVGLLFTLVLLASTVYAKPPAGCDPWPSCKNVVEAYDIGVSNFAFAPKNFPEGILPPQTTVGWGLEEGHHNLSICALGSALPNGTCGTADVLFSKDFNKNQSVITVNFADFELPGGTVVNYFCSIHGTSKKMVGTVSLP